MTAARVAVRTHGGAHVGFGHFRRSLTLAAMLRRLGADVVLLVNDIVHSRELALSAGESSLVEVDDGDLASFDHTRDIIARLAVRALVVDSYQATPAGLGAVPVPVALVADALLPAPWPVRLITCAAPGAPEWSWPTLPGTRLLLGTRYALLREEFGQHRERTIRDGVERVLVTTGGSDMSGLTLRFVQAVRATIPDAAVDVIIGPFFRSSVVEALSGEASKDRRLTLHASPLDVRALMRSADLALSAGGQATFELAATGTPAIATCVAENQLANVTGLASRGALLWAGRVTDSDLEVRLCKAVATLAGDPLRRAAMSQSARELVDGRGCLRVAGEILGLWC